MIMNEFLAILEIFILLSKKKKQGQVPKIPVPIPAPYRYQTNKFGTVLDTQFSSV